MSPHSPPGRAVVVVAARQHRLVDVNLSGDIDPDAESVLTNAVARIAELAPERVFVDLADVTFAGSTLPNFLARLVDVLPHAMSVTVFRPCPTHRRVLEVTGMAQILMIIPAYHGDVSSGSVSVSAGSEKEKY